MEKTITITSGNPIVDQVATMNLTGNIIPEPWYHTIINENGKTNTLAILILADIVYWYRPTEERDETTLSVSYSKKFHDEDYLQRSYEQLMEKFNISKRQARDALILLETLGVVKRHFRNIVVAGLPLSNVMYLELVPDVLKELADIVNTEYAGRVSALKSNPYFMEIFPADAGKGEAVHDLAKLLSVDIKDTLAAGDAENDISMLEAAGTGIAMFNAEESVKKAADVITLKDNNNDGLAEFFINNSL